MEEYVDLHTPNARIIKTRIMIRYCNERYVVGSIDCSVKWDEVVHFCFVEPFYKTQICHTGGENLYDLYVMMRNYGYTYWWKSCWIYRRQLMWCKMRRSKKFVGSWVWARPNQCCTLSSWTWLVIAFYIRFEFFSLMSVWTTFFLIACY